MSQAEIETFNYLHFNLKGKMLGQIKTTCVFPDCIPSSGTQAGTPVSINIDQGVFSCHRCGRNGSIHKFRAVRRQEKIYAPVPVDNIGALSQAVYEYFEKRGISKETVDYCGIGYIREEFMPHAGKKMGCITFPYYKDGILVNIKYRSGDKGFKMVKDAPRILCNIDAISDSMDAIIVEGEVDMMSFIEAGFKNVVSVPNGATKGATQNLEYLNDCMDYFDNKKEIYLATDNDGPGLMLRDELARRLGQERCLRVDFRGFKDANEVLVNSGKKALEIALNEATPYPIEGILRLTDMEDELDALYQEGLKPGLDPGIPGMREYLTLEFNRLMIISGIPSHGKSEFCDQLIERTNTIYGIKWGIFSPENFPSTVHIAKLTEKYVGTRFRKELIPEQEYVQAKQHINDNLFFINPPDDSFNFDYITERAKILIQKYGIKGVLIDPWNKIEHQRPAGLSETEYTGQQLDKLLKLAHYFKCLVVLVAHPTKMRKEPGGRYEVPTLYNINGSAHFFNKAEYGLTIYRDIEKNKIEIHFQKIKFWHLGNVGMLEYDYNPNNGRFTLDAIGHKPDNRNHLKQITDGDTTTTDDDRKLIEHDDDQGFPF